jgi:hypothetical protein
MIIFSRCALICIPANVSKWRSCTYSQQICLSKKKHLWKYEATWESWRALKTWNILIPKICYQSDRGIHKVRFQLYVCFFNLCGGTLGTAATTALLYQPRIIGDDDCGEICGMKIGRGNRSTRRKPARAPLCPPQSASCKLHVYIGPNVRRRTNVHDSF